MKGSEDLQSIGSSNCGDALKILLKNFGTYSFDVDEFYNNRKINNDKIVEYLSRDYVVDSLKFNDFKSSSPLSPKLDSSEQLIFQSVFYLNPYCYGKLLELGSPVKLIKHDAVSFSLFAMIIISLEVAFNFNRGQVGYPREILEYVYNNAVKIGKMMVDAGYLPIQNDWNRIAEWHQKDFVVRLLGEVFNDKKYTSKLLRI